MVGEDGEARFVFRPSRLGRRNFHASATAEKYPPTLGGHSLFFARFSPRFFLNWGNCTAGGVSAKIYVGWFVEGVEFGSGARGCRTSVRPIALKGPPQSPSTFRPECVGLFQWDPER